MRSKKFGPIFHRKISLLIHHNLFLMLIYAAIAFILVLSLMSYRVSDSCYFYYASDGIITNWCGSLGANVAAILFNMLGMATWFIMIWCCYASYYYWRHYTKQGVQKERLCFLLLLPVLIALLHAWYQIEYYSFISPGGMIGSFVVSSLISIFDIIGTAFLLHGIFFAFLTIMFPEATLYLLSKIWCGLRILISRKTMIILCKAVYQIVLGLNTLIVAGLGFIIRALSGSHTILGNDQSVITFEQIYADSDACKQDPFWQSLLQQPTIEPQEVKVESPGIVNHKNESNFKNDITQNISQDTQPTAMYILPDISLFSARKKSRDDAIQRSELQERAQALEQKLERFGVVGRVTAIKEGPVVTLFEYQPQIDTKISKILALEDDLAMALQALSIRILAPIPGRSVVGFEVANNHRSEVLFADSIRSKTFQDFKGGVPLILGEDTIGNQVVVDLAKMPHLLIAGSTGSGKSVALNAMLVGILCKISPVNLNLILIDPKRLEFAPYADIPHLLFPIITDPKKVAPVLKWVVLQMENRYELMARTGMRNVSDYNSWALREHQEALPTLVVVIDELADLMMTASRDVEDLIARIAQMARAAGIHLMVATQRPSVDVITGLIKVNFTSRISFRVTSKIDSRTILDCGGADKLLGRGDMLFLDSTSSTLKRVHGAYVSDKEIETVVAHVRSQGRPHYLDITQELAHEQKNGAEEEDQLFQDVRAFVQSVDEVSISLLQRKFRIGYNRSARIIDMLEAQGIILPSENGKTRKVVR